MALIEIKNNIATATNGSILVKLDLMKTLHSELSTTQVDLLNGKYIHMEVWKEFHKCDGVDFTDMEIICHKNGIKKIFEYSEPQGQFFDTNQVVIDIKEAGEEAKRLVSFDPKLIAKLAKIFGGDVMHFSFSPGNKGAVVFPEEYEGVTAILMPKHTELAPNRYLFY